MLTRQCHISNDTYVKLFRRKLRQFWLACQRTLTRQYKPDKSICRQRCLLEMSPISPRSTWHVLDLTSTYRLLHCVNLKRTKKSVDLAPPPPLKSSLLTRGELDFQPDILAPRASLFSKTPPAGEDGSLRKNLPPSSLVSWKVRCLPIYTNKCLPIYSK